MNSILSTALSGMSNAVARVDRAAQNIADPAKGQETLVEDIVDIKFAEHEFKANLAVIRVQDEMQKELLNTLDVHA